MQQKQQQMTWEIKLLTRTRHWCFTQENEGIAACQKDQ